MTKMQPASQPAHVPRPLVTSMQVAETATNKAAKVTGFIGKSEIYNPYLLSFRLNLVTKFRHLYVFSAEKVGIATVRLGQYLAPHIQNGGTKLLVKGFNIPEQQASDKMKGVLTVAAGAVEGFSAIYRGLETSAAVLGNSLKENTVKIVEHK